MRIYHNGVLNTSVKLSDRKYLEFKLDESLNDIYGYIVDLHDYIYGNGIFRVDLDIPGGSVRSYPVCYIKGFNYQFVGAPYIFNEVGKILFPTNMQPVINDDWLVTGQFKSLEFSINESSKDKNDWVSERKLIIPFTIGEEIINLEFDLPVLYWKYNKQDEWLIQQPEDIMIKSLPNNIYITGDLDLSNAIMYITDSEDMGETEIRVNRDTKNDLYYFRTVDVLSFLNREKTYRELNIRINDKSKRFFNIVCKSVVKSQSISGDFNNGIIYGYFDIFGDSEYMVTIKYGDVIIEEDVPVINGKFEVECDVKEGEHTVYLYEIVDDDSGFGSISYELDHYTLNIVDKLNFSGKTIEIQYIRDKQNKVADLPLKREYCIKNLKRLDYSEDFEDGDIYTWLYDSNDHETMSKFVYYSGSFGYFNMYGYYVKLTEVIVIFNNMQNLNEVLINTALEDYYEGLEYSPDKETLQPNKKVMNKFERRRIRMIDDDMYTIGIQFRG